jgi:hypothetical protein
MAISSQPSAPLRLTLTLLSLAVWACSNGGAGEGTPTDGTGQHIDDSRAGSGGADGTDGAAQAGAGGMDSAPEPDVEGVGSATGTPDPDPGTGAKGSTDTPDTGEGGTSGDSDPEPEPEPHSAEFLRGEALVEQNECATCHQANFAGFTVFPNITPDEATGIGSWSDEQIISAIRDGVDADGESMCPTMMRYSFDQEQLSDIVAFLRGLPAVKNKITSQCPGHGK